MGVLDKLEKNKNPNAKKNGGKGTNVGNALRWLAKQGKTFAPELLDLAGQVTGVKSLSVLGDAIRGDDNLEDVDKQLLLRELEYDMVEMAELTKRLESDNEHAITRLVRPVSYTFVLLNLAFFMYFDGNVGEFTIDDAWKPLIINLAIMMTGFYFGSRGLEKVAKVWGKTKNKE